MGEKDLAKKMGNKIGSGVLFVAACYVAMYILKEFSDNLVFVAIAAVLLLVSAFLFLNALFTEKAKEWSQSGEVEEKIPSTSGDGEFRLKVTKHMKEMESTQKEMLDVLKNQNTLLKAEIENLEHEIYMLSEKQVNQAKSIIKFNKENARQLAISERETLELVMQELKKAIEDNAVAIPAGFVAASAESMEQPVPAAEPVMEAAAVLEEVSEEDLFTVSDLQGDDEYVMPEVSMTAEAEPVETISVPEEIPAVELPTEEIPVVEEVPTLEEMEIPEMPADIDLTQLFDIPELEETPAAEPEPEPAPAADPLAGLSSDPNAMMTPEDIAKLLASMGQ